MVRRDPPPPPLDALALERMALRYVERFATTRGKLAAYLRRKLHERGWSDADTPPPVEGLVERIAALGYVDDAAWAEAKAASMTRRGLGARRVRQALTQAGVEPGDTAPIEPALDGRRIESALAFARRRRIGPYAAVPPAGRAAIERDVARMVRAGHAPDLARRIARMTTDSLFDGQQIADLEAELTRSLS